MWTIAATALSGGAAATSRRVVRDGVWPRCGAPVMLDPLQRMRGVVVGTKDVLLGKGVGRDDEQSPPFLAEEVCLVPGAPVVRVENAPGNARRIFTGIDIVANSENVLEQVWQTLTDYDNLAEVVPNLVANEVVSRTTDGARLKQLGAAKLAPGVTFVRAARATHLH